MKQRSTLLLFAASLSLATTATTLAQREVMPLDQGWLFLKGGSDIFAPSALWEKVSVPHTWNALDAQSGPAEVSDKPETEADAKRLTEERNATEKVAQKERETKDPHLKNKYYQGDGWYEHAIQVPAEWKGEKRVFARFGAAGTVARTYINKTLLGEHRGGFTAFCYELTPYLKFGQTNELRVQVDNTHREDLPPLSGDFNVQGGLYRDAEIIVTDEFCISPLDDASPGVYLTTRSLNEKEAIVEIRTMVSDGHTAQMNVALEKARAAEKNHLPGAPKPETQQEAAAADSVTVQCEVKDASGQVVASASTNQSVPPEETLAVVQNLPIPSPHRWNGRKDPYLYSITVSLISEGKTIDQVVQPLGLRTVAISQEKGFLLNGEPYPVYGVNRHQDLRNKGWALSPQDEERDASLMKEMGVTAVRNAHYPQSENWHRINDREGVLLWDEVSLVDTTRDTWEFWANSEVFLREMIHQLYNHPSIAWWGIFNELGQASMPPSDKGLQRLQSAAKEIDTSRLLVAASCHPNKSFNHVPEQIGLNLYPGWYQKVSEPTLADRVASFSKEVGKRIAVSEYGAGANISHHTEGTLIQPLPAGSFHPEEWQAFVHERDWKDIADNPNLWGSFVWNMFDFAYRARNEGNSPALNDKGLATHDRRFRKDAFFFYKANWNPDPMVYITSRRAVNRTLPTTDVKVYSNCPEVILSVNGKSLGVVKPDDLKIAHWSGITLQPGKNTIQVTAKSGEKPLEDSCVWTLLKP